jgi:hypothetical protein
LLAQRNIRASLTGGEQRFPTIPPLKFSPLPNQDEKARLWPISPHRLLQVFNDPWLLKKSRKICLDGKAGIHHHVFYPFQGVEPAPPMGGVAPLLGLRVKSAPGTFLGDKAYEDLSFGAEEMMAFL